jgi:transcriptional regulator with XRE-family HTH domain
MTSPNTGQVLPFPSRRPPARGRHQRRKGTAPTGQIVEVVRLHSAIGQQEDALLDLAVRIARAPFVSGDSAERAAELVRQLLLRPTLLPPPFRKFHSGTPTYPTFPKWLSYSSPLWQYANMANGQNGYKRHVANDTSAPNRIRELREAIGMSQAELARRANVTPSALNKLELGSRGLDQDWMRRLAPILGVAPADLLPLEDNPDVLSDEERVLIERFRSASARDRATLARVADAVLPFGLKDRDAA